MLFSTLSKIFGNIFQLTSRRLHLRHALHPGVVQPDVAGLDGQSLSGTNELSPRPGNYLVKT